MTLLALIALQLLGGIAFASECFEPCPDDTEETSCPPVCTLCTSCTHGQMGILEHGPASSPRVAEHPFAIPPSPSMSSSLADDIFHVPLRG